MGCPESWDEGGHQSWTCDPEQAEPGSNGMAFVRNGLVALCQHGARRLALLNLTTKKTSLVVSEFKGRRLNGPNDVVFHDHYDLWPSEKEMKNLDPKRH